jgi:hypothetical protein
MKGQVNSIRICISRARQQIGTVLSFSTHASHWLHVIRKIASFCLFEFYAPYGRLPRTPCYWVWGGKRPAQAAGCSLCCPACDRSQRKHGTWALSEAAPQQSQETSINAFLRIVVCFRPL